MGRRGSTLAAWGCASQPLFEGIDMKSLLVCMLALAPFAVGCGTIEYDRDPAYPQQVGYSAPSQQQVAEPMPQPPQGTDVAPQQQAQDTAIGAPANDEYADTD